MLLIPKKRNRKIIHADNVAAVVGILHLLVVVEKYWHFLQKKLLKKMLWEILSYFWLALILTFLQCSDLKHFKILNNYY